VDVIEEIPVLSPTIATLDNTKPNKTKGRRTSPLMNCSFGASVFQSQQTRAIWVAIFQNFGNKHKRWLSKVQKQDRLW